MKKFAKILLIIELVLWTLLSGLFVVYLYRQTGWAVGFANGICKIFGRSGQGPAFLTWLGGFLLWFSIGLGALTLLTIVSLVHLSNEEKVEEFHAEMEKRRVERKQRHEQRTQKRETKKNSKTEQPVIEEPKKEEPKPQRTTSEKRIDDFLSKLGKK